MACYRPLYQGQKKESDTDGEGSGKGKKWSLKEMGILMRLHYMKRGKKIWDSLKGQLSFMPIGLVITS